MKLYHLILIVVLTLISKPSFADLFGYNKVVTVVKETNSYKFIHFHDWSEKTRKKRFEVTSNENKIFSDTNDFSFLLCVKKKTSDTIFKKPCSVIENLIIDSKNEMVIGISEIKLWNPYQLVVYDFNGNLIFKKRITNSESKLEKVFI